MFFLLGLFYQDACPTNMCNCSKNNSGKGNFLSSCKQDKVMPPGIGPTAPSMIILLVAFTQPHQCEQQEFPLQWFKVFVLFCHCKNNYLFLLLDTLLCMVVHCLQIRQRRKDVKCNNCIPDSHQQKNSDCSLLQKILLEKALLN